MRFGSPHDVIMNRSRVVTREGKRSGRTLTVIGGVHGDEHCGVEALDELIQRINIVAGRVHWIYGNPRAIERNMRQTEMNLNRAFLPETLLSPAKRSSYERQRALELMPYLRMSDALLDVHASNTPGSTPFLICPPQAAAIAERLPFSLRSNGWDALEPGGTDAYVNQCGGIGLCAECGYSKDPHSVTVARAAIYAFLRVMGAITDCPLPPKTRQRVVRVHTLYRTKMHFLPSRVFQDFELLQPGERVGTDSQSTIHAPRESGHHIIFCRERKGANEEAFILGQEVEE